MTKLQVKLLTEIFKKQWGATRNMLPSSQWYRNDLLKELTEEIAESLFVSDKDKFLRDCGHPDY